MAIRSSHGWVNCFPSLLLHFSTFSVSIPISRNFVHVKAFSFNILYPVQLKLSSKTFGVVIER